MYLQNTKSLEKRWKSNKALYRKKNTLTNPQYILVDRRRRWGRHQRRPPRQRQRGRLLGDAVGRPATELATLLGILATRQSRQRSHRCILHPRSAATKPGCAPEGVVHDVQRAQADHEVDQSGGDEGEHRPATYAQHHEHRRCCYEVGEC